VIRRTLPSILMTLILVVGAIVVLGRPDPAAAARFFSGEVPTIEDGEAVVALISWIVIGGITAISIGGSIVALTRSEFLRQRSRRAALLFSAGVLLLAVSIVQRSLPASLNLCCGDEVTATQELEAVAGR
jgi:hypothetical protein